MVKVVNIVAASLNMASHGHCSAIPLPAASSCAETDGSTTDISEGFAANCCGVIKVGVATGVVWAEAEDTGEGRTT